MNLIKPNCLKRGDKIAIISPSSPITSMISIKESFSVFNKYGLEPVLGQNVKNLRSIAWSSGTIKDRVDEIEWAFNDSNINGVIAAEGGYSCMELLPYLPYKMIRDSRRPFMGMSDVTAINTAILSSSGLINFSGPNVRIRMDFKDDIKNFDDALGLLMCSSPWNDKPFYRNNATSRSICGGIVKGKAIGGNMTLFCSLIGTPYFPDVDKCVLFFEDVYAGGYEVSMNLNRLELAGILDKISGIVFGEFLKQPSRSDKDFSVEDVLVERFRERIPCIYGMNFSHGATVATIPLGVDCILDADNCDVKFDNPFHENIVAENDGFYAPSTGIPNLLPPGFSTDVPVKRKHHLVDICEKLNLPSCHEKSIREIL